MAQVRKHITPAGVSYEWLSHTPEELAAVMAASDQPAWIEKNATVVETITASGLAVPPSATAPPATPKQGAV